MWQYWASSSPTRITYCFGRVYVCAVRVSFGRAFRLHTHARAFAQKLHIISIPCAENWLPSEKPKNRKSHSWLALGAISLLIPSSVGWHVMKVQFSNDGIDFNQHRSHWTVRRYDASQTMWRQRQTIYNCVHVVKQRALSIAHIYLPRARRTSNKRCTKYHTHTHIPGRARPGSRHIINWKQFYLRFFSFPFSFAFCECVCGCRYCVCLSARICDNISSHRIFYFSFSISNILYRLPEFFRTFSSPSSSSSFSYLLNWID